MQDPDALPRTKIAGRFGGGLLIHPDLFAQTDFQLFCYRTSLSVAPQALICSLLFGKCSARIPVVPRLIPRQTTPDCQNHAVNIHQISINTSAFTGTDRGLLRSVWGPWSPVPKCEAPGAPISVEEHTSMAPRSRRQSQNPPLQKSSAIPGLPWPSKPRLRNSPGLAPTTRLNALLNAESDS